MNENKKIEIKDLVMIYAPNKKILRKAAEEYRKGASPEKLFKDYGVTVGVNRVSMEIQEGEIMVVMGLSGSGKSTLLKCLNLLNKPTEGQILVDGENILDYGKQQLRALRQKKISMVFQDFGLLNHRTVLENAMYGLEVSRVPKKEAREKAMDVLKTVGLEGWEHKLPRELSGGMQQRVGFARALANDPEILLMDEPFGALDPLIRQQMQNELLEIQARMKKTIVFITHDIDEAFRLGNHVAIMKDGIIHQNGTPREIMQHPATDYVKRFVQGVNRLRFVKAKDIAITESELLDERIPCVDGEITLHQIIPFFEGCDDVCVTDAEGNRIGHISKDAFLREIQEAEEPTM